MFMNYKTLRHKVHTDMFGVIEEDLYGTDYEVCMTTKPDLLGEGTTWDLLIDYWTKHSRDIVEQLQDYDLVTVQITVIN